MFAMQDFPEFSVDNQMKIEGQKFDKDAQHMIQSLNKNLAKMNMMFRITYRPSEKV